MESIAVRQNVELKARLANLDQARLIAGKLSGGDPETLRQRDTYFRCAHGRLKLREIEGQRAELIAYWRPDDVSARTSDYEIVPVIEPAALRAALGQSLGLLVVVEKVREFFLYKNVRIHLDQVRGLGTFLEFEAVLSTPNDRPAGERLVGELVVQFALTPDDLIGCSYSDMLLAAGR